MSIMRAALAKALVKEDFGELKEMAVKAIAAAKSRKRKLSKDPFKAYEQRIRRSSGAGIGPLRPCAHLDWKPGSPAMADGKPCRIKWGLSDGKENFVVVFFDHHRVAVTGSEKTSSLGVVTCNCLGYIHTRGCKPH